MLDRRLSIGAMLALGLASPSLAADLMEPTRVAAQRPMLQQPAVQALGAPAPLWSGPYAGIHFGIGIADWDRDLDFVAIDCTPCRNGNTAAASFAAPSRDDTAVLAGLQAGYNWQAGALVVGLEADWSWTGLRDRTTLAVPATALVGAGLGAITAPVDGFVAGVRSEVDWLATARGRIGWASGNLLFYGTGGLAFADIDTRVGSLGFAPARSPDPIPAVSHEQSVRVGWTLGAGVEAALASNLSAKVEYLYADFGRDRTVLGPYIDAPGQLYQSATLDEKVALHSIKLGLNYRFPNP